MIEVDMPKVKHDETERIIMQRLEEMQPTFAPRSGRDLFWFRLEGRPFTWVYMLNNTPIASVWWHVDRWYYLISYQARMGEEAYQTDAFAAVETYLSEDDELDGD